MATVYFLLPTYHDFFAELQARNDIAEAQRHKRFKAVLLLQRMTRGYLIRKYLAWLSYNATIIQCAFRMHQARKAYRDALRWAVRLKHTRYYAKLATKIQALWRGYFSRRTKFCYRRYRRWLATVTERGDRRAAEAAEFGIRSRADDIRILEEEARQWLAFVVFKLHHLLRTFVCAGVYSNPMTHELTEFEKLLKSIQFTKYMKRLRQKYEDYVRKHKPKFSNKRLFPVIGDGADYWYLSLPEMYELTSPVPVKKNTRDIGSHHGPQHKKMFLWRRVSTCSLREGRGPFYPPKSLSKSCPPPPSPSGDSQPRKDPRFHLYVKHYKPEPDLLEYVDYHVNVLLKRRCSLEHMDQQNVTDNQVVSNMDER